VVLNQTQVIYWSGLIATRTYQGPAISNHWGRRLIGFIEIAIGIEIEIGRCVCYPSGNWQPGREKDETRKSDPDNDPDFDL